MIQGRNILIYEGDVVIAAAKSCTINNNAEALENSSPASGTARSYTVGRTGWDISISTLVLGMKDHLLKVGQAYRLVWKVRGNDSDAMQGTAICTNAQVEATVGNLAQGSFQFLGSDDNGTIVTPPTPTPSDYVTEQDVVNIINQYDFTTEQWVQNYAGIANGMITIGHNSISPVTSVAMTVPTGFSVSGSPISKTGTLALAYATGYEGFTTALKEKIEALYSWFEVDADGDVKTKDTAGGHVRGLYSESFVSSLGKNSSSGGGGVDLTAVWASLTNTDSPTYSETLKININHIPNIGWSKIDNKPTTLAGYGITDAKIASGTITLGSNTITPLTASSSLAWGKLTGTPTTLAGYGIGDAKIANGVITLGSSTITPVTSVAMTVPTGFSVSGSPISKTGTLALAYATGYEGFTTALKEKIEALYSWFEVDAAGDIKTKDMPNGTHRGFYTESFVSALGANSQGGGSSTFDEPQMWTALQSTTGTYATTKIATSHIPDMASTYGYLKSSALNGYATQSWVNQQGFLTSHQTLYTLSIYGGTTKVLDFKPNANASIYIKAGGDISLANDTINKHITLSYTHPTNGANTTISAASGKVLSAITVNSLGHVTSVSSKTLASADIPDISATYATASRATTLEGYFNSGGVAKVAAKLGTGTTTYSAWGQTYWSSGVPQSISGNMTSVGSITPSANGNALGTSSARFNIYGTSGNFSGNVSITGTLGVTGATTLTGLLTANGNIKTGTSNGAYIQIGAIKLVYDSTNNALKVIKSDDSSANFYATGAVSALGANSSGGGSGTFDEEAMWEALGTTSTAKVIASSHIPNLSASKITSGTLADARIPSLAASKITSGTFDTARIPNLDASKITSGTLAAARIPDLSGRYYALYGGTPLTGTSSSHYDLNNLLTVGSYYCAGSVTAAYIDNKPTNTNSAFRVWVSATTGTASGNYIRQRFQFFTQVIIYERVAYNDSGVTSSDWGNWCMVQRDLSVYALASSLDGYLPLSGGTMESAAIIRCRRVLTNLSNGNSGMWAGSYYTGSLSADDVLITTTTPASDKIVLLAGYVGIGTYTPAYKLDVVGSIRASGVVYVGNGGADGNSYVASDEADNIYLRNSSGAVLVCDSKVVRRGTTLSDVTLGSSSYPWLAAYATTFYGALSGNATTATTASKLSTTSKTAWGQTYWTSGGVPTSISGNLSDVGNITATNYMLSDTADNPYLKFINTYNSTNYTFYVQAYQGLLYLGAGSTKSIAVDSAGSVGVGTSSPSYKLHVYGNIAATTANSGTIRLVSSNSTNFIQSGNAAFDGNADMTIGGYAGHLGSNLNLEFSTVNATNNLKVKSLLFMNYGAEGIYLTSTGINWHNASDTWTKSIMGFNSAGEVHLSGGHLILEGAVASSSTGNTTQIIFRASNTQQVAISSNSSALIINPTSSTTTKQIVLGVGSVASTFGNSITCNGEVTASSDGRKKNIISNTKFNVKDIASARSVLFEWNDGRDDDMEKKIHGGSIAQDWLGKADSFLSQDNDGFYSINYGALALCSAITIAREVLKHEDEITRLKKVVVKQAEEIVDLKNKVREFEERRVA